MKGDQEYAVNALNDGLNRGLPAQTLMGVTGSGKTFTMANIIAKQNRPTLVISHNKTLAAQLASEFREFFPENSVEYFVSYYDYYQPEAYISASDTYIEKDSSINVEIDRLRHSATQALLERRDTLIVASVSCIYGLGSPEDYKASSVFIRTGVDINREYLLKKLIQMQFEANKMTLERGSFRMKGEVLELFPVDGEYALRINFWGDEVEEISKFDPLTGEIFDKVKYITIYPAKHFVTPQEKLFKACDAIEKELDEQLAFFKSQDKIVEAERLKSRTLYDLEMLREIGYCKGIENYSRHLTGRVAGQTPYTLLDYYPSDFLTFIDESHVTMPQLRAMCHGDRSRKESLVNYGFRLPSAFDNRPLFAEEFEARIGQTIYVSATPAPYELQRSPTPIEQIIRPTGIPDPKIEVRPISGQVTDLIEEVKIRAEKRERVLVTTLTKKMAEDLANHMHELGLKVRYLHSEVETLDRIKLLQELRMGVFDCLVGINLLREGLDLPEVSLVAILDADKEGFLRSETSLIQTIGRAARNSTGSVIMYADTITDSMKRAIDETERRRKIQIAYNEEHGIRPETVKKAVKDILDELAVAEKSEDYSNKKRLNLDELKSGMERFNELMKEAAQKLEFEKAAAYRDEMLAFKKEYERQSKAQFLPIR